MRKNRRTCLPDRSMMGGAKSPRTPATVPQPSDPKPESDTNDTASTYEKYLQTLMVEHLIKKKGEKRGKELLMQLASLEEKNEECQSKLQNLQIRIQEIELLNSSQHDMEGQFKQFDQFFAENATKLLKSLNDISSNLESFDKLTCEQMIIPTTSDELKTHENLLEQLDESLDSLKLLIGDKATPMISMNRDLLEFTNLFQTIEKLSKTSHDQLERAEMEILKKGSACLE